MTKYVTFTVDKEHRDTLEHVLNGWATNRERSKWICTILSSAVEKMERDAAERCGLSHEKWVAIYKHD